MFVDLASVDYVDYGSDLTSLTSEGDANEYDGDDEQLTGMSVAVVACYNCLPDNSAAR